MCRSGGANKTPFLRNKLTRTGALFSLVKHGVGTELSVNRQRVLYRQSFAMESDRSLREKSRLRRKGYAARTGTSTRTLQNNRLNYKIQ